MKFSDSLFLKLRENYSFLKYETFHGKFVFILVCCEIILKFHLWAMNMLLVLFTVESRLNMFLFGLIMKWRHLGLLVGFAFLFIHLIFPLGRCWLLLCFKLLSCSEMNLTLTTQYQICWLELTACKRVSMKM